MKSAFEITTQDVRPDEDGMRIDRWFKKHYEGLPFSRLQKLLRTGQIRVNGKRVKTQDRLKPGDQIRIPPFRIDPKAPERDLSETEAADIKSWLIYEDDFILAFNKPPGLATQGGTKTRDHLDRLLAAFIDASGDKPKLIHRLDRDTSGVILVARDRLVANTLMELFRGRDVQKTYWALTRGIPDQSKGRIDAPLHKMRIGGEDKVVVDRENGLSAQTDYHVLATHDDIAWVEAKPLTGRGHQIRVHLQSLGTPIVGDRKYGYEGSEKGLALHARRIQFTAFGKVYDLRAELPPALVALYTKCGFSPDELVKTGHEADPV